jgi:hypothetical protein
VLKESFQKIKKRKGNIEEMKKRTIGFILTIIFLVMSNTRTANAVLIRNPQRASTFYEEPTMVRCTCYIDRGTMASGQQTRYGAIAGRKEWIGKVAALYRIEDGKIGEFLGYFEFLDTGAGMDSDGDGRWGGLKL